MEFCSARLSYYLASNIIFHFCLNFYLVSLFTKLLDPCTAISFVEFNVLIFEVNIVYIDV